MTITIEQVARVAHEANRAYQVVTEDPEVAPAWEDAPQEHRDSVIEGVHRVIAGDSPEQLHQSWCDFKYSQGWTYGPVKDVKAKTHPCLVPYVALPSQHQVKDLLFLSVIEALLDPEETKSGAARAAMEFIEQEVALAKEIYHLDDLEHTTVYEPEEDRLVLQVRMLGRYSTPAIPLADATPDQLTSAVYQSLFAIYHHKEKTP